LGCKNPKEERRTRRKSTSRKGIIGSLRKGENEENEAKDSGKSQSK
jgi:hypothetical protein